MKDEKSPTLSICDGQGGYRQATAKEIFRAANHEAQKRFNRHPVISSPADTRDYLAQRFVGMEHEVFCALWLDNRNRVIAFDPLFRGTIDGASVHPREVVKRALELNAAAVCLAHNHPSGVAEPSNADEIITRRLRDALNLVDIRVLDHIVCGAMETVSFAERGLI